VPPCPSATLKVKKGRRYKKQPDYKLNWGRARKKKKRILRCAQDDNKGKGETTMGWSVAFGASSWAPVLRLIVW